MHAVLVSVTIKDPDAATTHLRENVVPQVRQAPGFVAGYWTRIADGNKGRATIVFETEEAAKGAAEQIDAPPEAVDFESIDVGEVVESA